MAKLKGRRTFSLNYLFASFFGALMIAGAFAYYNYKFSEYKFINFEKMVFYKKADIFFPEYEQYTILLYSSRKDDISKLLSKIKQKPKILAIDMFQEKRKGENENIIFASAGINTLLRFIQRFNIYELPCAFKIKRHNKYLYKQNSPIEVIR